MKFTTKSLDETKSLGRRLGSIIDSGQVIALEGDLGAGKTTFTKSLAEGLGVEDVVTSPTFNLINEYIGRLPVYHFDIYRLDGIDADYMGFDEYLFSEGVCIIEWAEKIKELLPEDTLYINIKKISETGREFEFTPKGEKSNRIMEVITSCWPYHLTPAQKLPV